MASAATETRDDLKLFLRLWDRQQLTPALAKHVLKLNFSANDRRRMKALAEENRAGAISPADLHELDSFVRVGTIISILKSRARRLLRKPVVGRGRG